MKSARRLRRFFSSQQLDAVGQIVSLTSSETHHLRDILRLRVGDRCFITDGSGVEAEAEVSEFLENGSSHVRVEKISRRTTAQEAPRVRTIQALAKKGKMEYLIEKAQELGVNEFWPIETERSVIHIPAEKQSKTLARWRKKASEAAKQSGVLKLLQVAAPQSFKEAVQAIPLEEETVVFHPDPKAIPFRKWIEQLEEEKKKGVSRRLNLFFGPEGGFSQREIDFAINYRKKTGNVCKIISLGATILKIDTAFLGVASSLKLLL